MRSARGKIFARILIAGFSSATFTREHKTAPFCSHVLYAPFSFYLSVDYTTRWTLYGILESTMGKACLLRAVCESSANPFNKGHGLLGELLHVFLTPSTTHEEYEIYSNREYHAAEEIGRDTRGQCAHFYSECDYSPLDYFTRLLWAAQFFFS